MTSRMLMFRRSPSFITISFRFTGASCHQHCGTVWIARLQRQSWEKEHQQIKFQTSTYTTSFHPEKPNHITMHLSRTYHSFSICHSTPIGLHSSIFKWIQVSFSSCRYSFLGHRVPMEFSAFFSPRFKWKALRTMVIGNGVAIDNVARWLHLRNGGKWFGVFKWTLDFVGG